MPLPLIVTVISFLFLYFLAEPGLAQQGIRLGRIDIHPGVTLQTEYNDNLFLDSDVVVSGVREVPQEDFIVTTSPFITVQQKREPGDHFGMVFRYLGYDQRFVQIKGQDFFNHDISGYLELGDAAGEVTWLLGGKFEDTRFPVSEEFAGTFNPRLNTRTTEADSSLLFKFTPKLEGKLKLKFTRFLIDQEQFSFQESDTYDWSGTILWQTWPLTGFGLNYSYQFIRLFQGQLSKCRFGNAIGFLQMNMETSARISFQGLARLQYSQIRRSSGSGSGGLDI